jgi:Ribbon-helix-helix protein, copG family
MHRTNLYLTDAQERALDQQARAEGVSRSALVRSIIDRELARSASIDSEVEDALRSLADHYHKTIGATLHDDPDLAVDR